MSGDRNSADSGHLGDGRLPAARFAPLSALRLTGAVFLACMLSWSTALAQGHCVERYDLQQLKSEVSQGNNENLPCISRWNVFQDDYETLLGRSIQHSNIDAVEFLVKNRRISQNAYAAMLSAVDSAYAIAADAGRLNADDRISTVDSIFEILIANSRLKFNSERDSEIVFQYVVWLCKPDTAGAVDPYRVIDYIDAFFGGTVELPYEPRSWIERTRHEFANGPYDGECLSAALKTL